MVDKIFKHACSTFGMMWAAISFIRPLVRALAWVLLVTVSCMLDSFSEQDCLDEMYSFS